MAIAKIVMNVIMGMGFFSMIAFVFTLIICRRGFQKHLDPIYMDVGTIGMFARDNSMAIMSRTLLYLGAAFTERGRERHFEGRDPRKEMPPYLRRWAVICLASGAIYFGSMVLFVVAQVATGQATLAEIFSR